MNDINGSRKMGEGGGLSRMWRAGKTKSVRRKSREVEQGGQKEEREGGEEKRRKMEGGWEEEELWDTK